MNGQRATSVFDHSQKKSILISGTVTSTAIEIFDHAGGCYLGGTKERNSHWLYQYRDHHLIELTVQGAMFTGYDYRAGDKFNRKVEGKSITLHDPGYSTPFHYSL